VKNVRVKALAQWVSDVTGNRDGLVPLPVEASARKFYRTTLGERSVVVMDAPPDTEDNAHFVALSNCFRHAEVSVPEVLASDLERGFLLVEDFGDNLLEHTYGLGQDDKVLGLALAMLVRIQGISDPIIPTYTTERFTSELGIFRKWVLQDLIGVSTLPFDDVIDFLVRTCDTQPKVTIHRDFHCRNLLLKSDGTIGAVDFQDALVGPISYDLASILYDCYYQFSDATIATSIARYLQLSREAGHTTTDDEEDFTRALEITAVQRQLKAVGIFARLKLKQDRASHLENIVPVMRRVCELMTKHRELVACAKWLETTTLHPIRDAVARLR
jgi:hypothetical protein